MKWNIDAGHSAIEFGVKHLGISTTKGRFQKFQGSVTTDLAGKPEHLEVTIDAASLDTNLPDRDKHLRSADFFDVERHPTIGFRSAAVTGRDDGTYQIDGELTMRGVTRPVSLSVEAGVPVKDPWGNRRIAGQASGKLNRKDWGLTWNQVLEAGGLLVSEDVKISLDIEVIEERAATAA